MKIGKSVKEGNGDRKQYKNVEINKQIIYDKKKINTIIIIVKFLLFLYFINIIHCVHWQSECEWVASCYNKL